MEATNTITSECLGAFLIDGISRIDKQCSTLRNGIEHGLCNVKLQFRDDALIALGRKCTEELLVAWLLGKQLRDNGCVVRSEYPYSGTREKCDLVVKLPSGERIWIEIKHAWKHWFSCDGSAGTSSAYRGYLFGDASHAGTAHDFDKLERVGVADADWVGVLLIGFESKALSMNNDVQDLMAQNQLSRRGWNLSANKNWTDRRNPEFGIGVWFWMRSTIAKSSFK